MIKINITFIDRVDINLENMKHREYDDDFDIDIYFQNNVLTFILQDESFYFGMIFGEMLCKVYPEAYLDIVDFNFIKYNKTNEYNFTISKNPSVKDFKITNVIIDAGYIERLLDDEHVKFFTDIEDFGFKIIKHQGNSIEKALVDHQLDHVPNYCGIMEFESKGSTIGNVLNIIDLLEGQYYCGFCNIYSIDIFEVSGNKIKIDIDTESG